MRIWITRAEPDARRTAAAVAGAGHRPLISPLLRIEPLKDAAHPLAKALVGVGALAFTSANGVRAFAQLRPLSDRHLPAFTVGAATAGAAREAGFATVLAADGDVAALAKAIAAQAARPAGVILHCGALEPAGDLTGELERRGVAARFLAVYQSVAQAPTDELLAALRQDPPGVDGVLIHSGRAAAELAILLAQFPGAAQTLTAIFISKAAAKPLKAVPFARRAVAAQPHEAAMLAELTS